VPRSSSDIIDGIYRRAADLLQIDESLLTSDKNAEDLQVVHYTQGQRYDSHHDWGVSGYPNSRFLTLLMYLTDQPSAQAGGETSFPKGGSDHQGFKVRPRKGHAVLFYNLLEDGNGDDFALHAALPPIEGEKWLANFWVWDPKLH
jgi:prolyl 4-hydroxylase